MADSKGFFFESVIIRCGDKTVELEHVHSTNRRLQRLMELGYDMTASLDLSVNSDRRVATLLGLLQFMSEDEDQSLDADLAPAELTDSLSVNLKWHHVELLRRTINEHYRGYRLPDAVLAYARSVGHWYWYQIVDDIAQNASDENFRHLVEPFNEFLRTFGLSVSTDLSAARQFLLG